MKNIILIFSTLLLIVGCGSGYEDKGNVDRSRLPLIYKVNRDKYERYKRSFDHVEESYKSKSGVDLVKFIPDDKNPKFSNMKDAFSTIEYVDGKYHNRVFFKESGSEFTDIGGTVRGVHYGNVTSGYGNIFVNIHNKADSYNRVKKVMLHEVGHAVGFGHPPAGSFSVMNSNWLPFLPTLTRFDRRNLHKKYPFSMSYTTEKDLESIGAADELEQFENMKAVVAERFGLSQQRTEEVSRIMFSLEKMKSKRAISKNDWNMATKKLFGFDYDSGKKALEEHIQGSSGPLDKLVDQAADLNDVTPEHIKEILSEYLL
ncbi:MAG: hypothetical protein ACO20H_11325 [Bacteriovoracaceae bacterium]